MMSKVLKSKDLVRSALFFCLLLASVLCFAEKSIAQEKPLDWYQIGRGLLTKGTTPETATFEARLRYVISSIRQRGVSFELTDFQEKFLRNSGSNDELIMAIRETRKVKSASPSPSSAEYFFLRGNACPSSDENCQLNNYTQAIQRNPAYVDAYNNRALAFSHRGQTVLALKDFAKVMEVSPNFALLYLNRGTVYQELQNHRQAIDDFNRAIEINPMFVTAYYNRGVSLAKLGNTAQAIADYNKTISLNPAYSDAYLNRGAIYGREKKYDLALKDFTKAIGLNPKDSMAYNNRGIIYEQLGDGAKAQADYRKAQSLKNLAGEN